VAVATQFFAGYNQTNVTRWQYGGFLLFLGKNNLDKFPFLIKGN
jgi:hypothetical protein